MVRLEKKTNTATDIPFADKYFSTLGKLHEKFEVTDAQSRHIPFSDGISRAASIILRQSKLRRKHNTKCLGSLE